MSKVLDLPTGPDDGRWDASQPPTGPADRARVERLWAEAFEIPATMRARLKAILGWFWDADLPPAAVMYAVAYHFPAVPPWRPTPTALNGALIGRLAERFTAANPTDLIHYHGPACLAYRLAYQLDDLGIAGPPPQPHETPRWLAAYDAGLAALRSEPNYVTWTQA